MTKNRFAKSVSAATANTTANIETNVPDGIIDNISEDIIDVTSSDILSNVIGKDKKERGANHSFYLSPEVAVALSKLAKRTKKSKSTLVNGILGEVLLK